MRPIVRSHVGRRAVAAAACLASGAFAFAATAAPAGAAPAAERVPAAVRPVNLCKVVSTATVGKVLGTRIMGVTGQLTPKGAVCWYAISGNSRIAYIAMVTGVTSKAFDVDKKNAKLLHRNPTPLKMFAPYSAYSESIKQQPYADAHMVTIKKGSRELIVGSSISSLGTVENLAKRVLPSI